MFSITLICMGKLKERFYTEAAAEYAKRLRAYCDFQLIELPGVPSAGGPERHADRAGSAKRSGAYPREAPEGLLFLRPDAGGEAAVL